MKHQPLQKAAEPPLKIRHFTRTDRATNAKIRITTAKRGILKSETRTHESLHAGLKELASISVVQEFEAWCDRLRDRLERWGIPSDRQRTWIKCRGGGWEPFAGDMRSEIKPGVSFANWYSRMKDLTEELSEQRLVGEMLWGLRCMLDREGIAPHLWHIGQVISSVRMLALSGPTNALVTAGITARRGRAVGPVAKRAKAAQRRDVIRSIAIEVWAVKPKYKEDAANTAALVVRQVNEELRKGNLLAAGNKDLSIKTIADHIRAISRGKPADLASAET
ncbi:MAG TPA: hypothetical protein VFB29_02210 [Pseudolabrys sp.]|nr:hypothetical protein [Pseudolabrys sp.]